MSELAANDRESKEVDAVRAATKKRFDEALDRFQRKLKPEEARHFQDMDAAKLEKAMSTIQKNQAAKYQAMHMPRVSRFVEAFKQFGELVEVFLNSSNYVAAVWGPMKLILQVRFRYPNTLIPTTTWGTSLNHIFNFPYGLRRSPADHNLDGQQLRGSL
jgi:hypothetical protein